MTRQNGDWRKLTKFLNTLKSTVIEVVITDKGLATITDSIDMRQDHPKYFAINHGGENSIRKRAEDAGYKATYDSCNKRIKHFKLRKMESQHLLP